MAAGRVPPRGWGRAGRGRAMQMSPTGGQLPALPARLGAPCPAGGRETRASERAVGRVRRALSAAKGRGGRRGAAQPQRGRRAPAQQPGGHRAIGPSGAERSARSLARRRPRPAPCAGECALGAPARGRPQPTRGEAAPRAPEPSHGPGWGPGPRLLTRSKPSEPAKPGRGTDTDTDTGSGAAARGRGPGHGPGEALARAARPGAQAPPPRRR